MTDALAQFDRVTRRFGSRIAVDDVSLNIRPGEILGLLGPNGAGKSTMISLLQGLRRPSAGHVRLFGGDPRDASSRMLLGSTPQETSLPDALRVSEVLDLVGSHFAERVPTRDLAEQFAFADLLKRQTGALSGGQKRRVAVALAFVGRPRLVLLDEPSTGLDVDARRVLWNAIRAQHADGVSIVVTSHYLEEIEALAERVVVVDKGRVLADDGLDAVRGRVGRRRVALRTPDPEAVALIDPGAHVEQDGELTVITTADSDSLVRSLVERNIPFSDLAVRGATLEEAFLSLTATQSTEGHAA